MTLPRHVVMDLTLQSDVSTQVLLCHHAPFLVCHHAPSLPCHHERSEGSALVPPSCEHYACHGERGLPPEPNHPFSACTSTNTHRLFGTCRGERQISMLVMVNDSV